MLILLSSLLIGSLQLTSKLLAMACLTPCYCTLGVAQLDLQMFTRCVCASSLARSYPLIVVSCAYILPLQLQTLFKHIGGLLEPSTLLLAETGDSIFNCQKLSLPDGCQYVWLFLFPLGLVLYEAMQQVAAIHPAAEARLPNHLAAVTCLLQVQLEPAVRKHRLVCWRHAGPGAGWQGCGETCAGMHRRRQLPADSPGE